MYIKRISSKSWNISGRTSNSLKRAVLGDFSDRIFTKLAFKVVAHQKNATNEKKIYKVDIKNCSQNIVQNHKAQG